MKLPLKTLLLLGILAEAAIFLACYFLHLDINEVFRYAARYSGRLSAVVFLFTFYQYAMAFPSPLEENRPVRNWVVLFAVLHLIHFGFLFTNIFLNDIPLETVKLAGGALAYAMIVGGPFLLHRLAVKFQLVYFYYVSLVMTLTYVARAKGDFEGAEPYWLHYLGIALFIGASIGFGWRMWRARAATT